jgi:2-dehydro-3-deoxyphosphogluconate aldolase/(4S)-4-hydroxy-2-oxoglutarate aldolase
MTPKEASATIREICALAPVIPVIVVEDVSRARPLAEALVAGGLPVLEVTLRTPAALEAIGAMAEVPGGVVGAGTLITPADVRAAKAAGALFGVSPGVTPALLDACEAEELPLLGGTATISEAMALLDRGYDVAKFFPAEASGGAAALRAFAGPLPQMAYCPTGGIGPRNARDYLALPNVLCVGGSWVCAAGLVRERRWDAIERLAREASALRGEGSTSSP